MAPLATRPASAVALLAGADPAGPPSAETEVGGALGRELEATANGASASGASSRSLSSSSVARSRGCSSMCRSRQASSLLCALHPKDLYKCRTVRRNQHGPALMSSGTISTNSLQTFLFHWSGQWIFTDFHPIRDSCVFGLFFNWRTMSRKKTPSSITPPPQSQYLTSDGQNFCLKRASHSSACRRGRCLATSVKLGSCNGAGECARWQTTCRSLRLSKSDHGPGRPRGFLDAAAVR